MKKNPPLSIPMISSNQSVLDFIREKFIKYSELSEQLGYNVSGKAIQSWLKAQHRPPDNFEKKCQTNIDKLNKFSEWKLQYGVFENYPKRKPQGFWQIKKTHRYALEWVCEQMGWEFPYGLYQLKKDTLFDLNIDGITNIYSESPVRIVTTVLPEYEWLIWKFHMTPMHYWADDDNKNDYLKWFEELKGITKPEDWYNVTINDFYENFGRTLLISYFDGSVAAVAKYLYSRFDFNYTNFIRTPPSLFDWKDIENVKSIIEKKADELDLKFPNGYYKLNMKKHFNTYGIRYNYFNVNTFSELLNKIYPNHTFYEWLFEKTPNGFWNNDENLIGYIEWLANQLKIESMEEWYDVNNDMINHYNGSGLLVQSQKNLFDLLSLTYPDYDWDVSKFGKKRFTSQRRLYKVITQIFPNNETLYDRMHPDIINPKTNRRLQLDCFLPDLNLAFEYQGAQHNEPSRFFHSKLSRDTFDDLQYRDKIKKKRCKELGIKLIEVIEGQWDFTKDGLLKIINSN